MKRTKIIATVSEKICQTDLLKKLHEAGANVFRLNTAHQSLDDALFVVNRIRSVSKDIAIMIDTKGPEVRSKLIAEPIEVSTGDVVYISGRDDFQIDGKLMRVSYVDFPQDIPVGAKIYLDDGDLEFEVLEKFPDYLKTEVKNNGFIKNKKSINVPGSSLRLGSLNEKDKTFIHFAIEQKVDFIAHSFVRNKEDIITIQKMLDEQQSPIKIIAKIENQEGVDHIDEILDYAYGVMVARGDLAIEVDAEQIPKIQKYIVNKCIESKKPVIVATQMLQSMIDHPRPTRAEVSDIAAAVFMGTDALMLSGETAYGDYPLESVQMMAKIAEANEPNLDSNSDRTFVRINNELTAALARAAVRLTTMLPVKAIVVDTLSGRTARYLSAFRGNLPVYALCYKENVKRELALSYGVKPYYTEKPQSRDRFMHDIPDIMLKEGYAADDYIVVVAGSFGDARGASFVEVCKIEDMKA